MTDISGGRAKVDLGEGVHAMCRLPSDAPRREEKATRSKADLSSLGSMLEARWKGGEGGGSEAKNEPVKSGQVRSFRIVKLDGATKKIDLELL